MMAVLTIISAVIITVVWGGRVAAQEVGMTPKADSAPGQNEEAFSAAEVIDRETAHFVGIPR